MKALDTNANRDLARQLADHADVASRTADAIRDTFPRLVDACLQSLQQGHTLLFFGNGGSAADAQHFAAELVVRYKTNRAAISAIALTTDTSVLTAIGNDLGFEDLFARQIEALCHPGDVAIGISTSGNSENVIRGLRAARAKRAVTAAFTGGNGGRLLPLVDHAIVVPSTTTARIQEMHLLIGHTLCALVEEQVARPTPTRPGPDGHDHRFDAEVQRHR
jgi:D-sedoheptulose 7-phosphate isomerase